MMHQKQHGLQTNTYLIFEAHVYHRVAKVINSSVSLFPKENLSHIFIGKLCPVSNVDPTVGSQQTAARIAPVITGQCCHHYHYLPLHHHSLHLLNILFISRYGSKHSVQIFHIQFTTTLCKMHSYPYITNQLMIGEFRQIAQGHTTNNIYNKFFFHFIL